MAKIRSESREFEIVEEVPSGYIIWHVGNLIDGYLPLAQPLADFRINPDTLKAVKCENSEIVMKAIGNGESNVKEMERYIKRHRNSKPGTWPSYMAELMKKALPYMKQIKGL